MYNLLKKSLIALSLIAVQGMGYAYDDTDKQQVLQKIDTVKVAMMNKDVDKILSVMPEKLFIMTSEKMNVDLADVKKMMGMMTERMFEQLEGTEITYTPLIEKQKVLSTAEGRDYSIIPTEMTIHSDDVNMKMKSNLFAVKDEGKWYIMSINSPQQSTMIMEIFPDIKEIALFESSVVNLDAE